MQTIAGTPQMKLFTAVLIVSIVCNINFYVLSYFRNKKSRGTWRNFPFFIEFQILP